MTDDKNDRIGRGCDWPGCKYAGFHQLDNGLEYCHPHFLGMLKLQGSLYGTRTPTAQIRFREEAP